MPAVEAENWEGGYASLEMLRAWIMGALEAPRPLFNMGLPGWKCHGVLYIVDLMNEFR